MYDCSGRGGKVSLHQLALEGDHVKLAEIIEKNTNKLELNELDRNGNSILYYAIKSQSLQVLEILLNQRPKINEKQENINKKNILHCAAKIGNVAIIKYLLKFPNIKELVDRKDNEGRLPFHYGGFSGNIEIIELLLTDKIKYDTPDYFSRNLLHFIVKKGHFDLFNEFYPNKIQNITPDTQGNSLLHYAAKSGNVALVDKIMQLNNDSFTSLSALSSFSKNLTISRNQFQQSPIFLACESGKIEVFKRFLSENQNLIYEKSRKGVSLLLTAARFGHEEIFDFISSQVPNGCTISDDEDVNGKNLLHFASKSGNFKFLMKLIEKFPEKINKISLDHGRNFLHYLILYSTNYLPENPIKLLLNYDFVNESIKNQINSILFEKDKDDFNYMHYSCLSGNLELTQYFINEKIEKKLEKFQKNNLQKENETENFYLFDKNKFGESPILSAAFYQFQSIVEYLLSSLSEKELIKISSEKNWKGENLLHLLSKFSANFQIYEKLVRYSNIEESDNDGFSALFNTAMLNNYRGFYILLFFGASLQSKVRDELNILHTAAYYGADLIISSILQFSPPPPSYFSPADADLLFQKIKKAKFNVNVPNGGDGSSPLIYACLKAREKTIRLLVDNGADVNYKNAHNFSPLHFACSFSPSNPDEKQIQVCPSPFSSPPFPSLPFSLHSTLSPCSLPFPSLLFTFYTLSFLPSLYILHPPSSLLFSRSAVLPFLPPLPSFPLPSFSCSFFLPTALLAIPVHLLPLSLSFLSFSALLHPFSLS